MPSDRTRPLLSARRAALIASALAAAWALTGCVVAPLPAYGYGGAVDTGPVVVATQAPPPLIYEPVLAAPAPGYFWINGFWSWSGGRHVWSRGRWEAPRAGYRWVPRQWSQGPGGWHQHGGHWAR